MVGRWWNNLLYTSTKNMRREAFLEVFGRLENYLCPVPSKYKIKGMKVYNFFAHAPVPTPTPAPAPTRPRPRPHARAHTPAPTPTTLYKYPFSITMENDIIHLVIKYASSHSSAKAEVDQK